MTRVKLQGAERVDSGLHLHWRVERDDGVDMLVTVRVASPRAAAATVHTIWSDRGTGDAALDQFVRRTNQVLVFAEAIDLAREWISDSRRPPNGLPPRRHGRRLAVVA